MIDALRPSQHREVASTGAALAPVLVEAARPGAQVRSGLGCPATGLTSAEASRRLADLGPNAVSSHRARLLPVLWHQLRSPLLGLLLVAATASFAVGQRSDAVIIGVIVGLSVGLGLTNEYRAEKAAEALHSQVIHRVMVVRDSGDLGPTRPRRTREPR